MAIISLSISIQALNVMAIFFCEVLHNFSYISCVCGVWICTVSPNWCIISSALELVPAGAIPGAYHPWFQTTRANYQAEYALWCWAEIEVTCQLWEILCQTRWGVVAIMKSHKKLSCIPEPLYGECLLSMALDSGTMTSEKDRKQSLPKRYLNERTPLVPNRPNYQCLPLFISVQGRELLKFVHELLH